MADAKFVQSRAQILKRVEIAAGAWNAAVATLVHEVGRDLKPLAMRAAGPDWHARAADAIKQMREPLRSDVILSTRTPMLKNEFVKGSVRAFCTTVLEQDLEFMPKNMSYPKFPYFTVEPATQQTLYDAGLFLFASPPGNDEEEPDKPGAHINETTYLRCPMVSVELKLANLPPKTEAAVLLNWSCRGRAGAKAKVFINGEQDVPSFEVMSTDDDATPNFWTFVPWSAGLSVIDLKHVGSGYLWFEHVDVHHVTWPA